MEIRITYKSGSDKQRYTNLQSIFESHLLFFRPPCRKRQLSAASIGSELNRKRRLPDR